MNELVKEGGQGGHGAALGVEQPEDAERPPLRTRAGAGQPRAARFWMTRALPRNRPFSPTPYYQHADASGVRSASRSSAAARCRPASEMRCKACTLTPATVRLSCARPTAWPRGRFEVGVGAARLSTSRTACRLDSAAAASRAAALAFRAAARAARSPPLPPAPASPPRGPALLVSESDRTSKPVA